MSVLQKLSASKRLMNKLKVYYDDLRAASSPGLPKSKTLFLLQGIANYALYGTSFSEFAAYGFYHKPREEKMTYMTRRHMFRFFDQYDPKELRDRIGNKAMADQYYGQFLKREQFRCSDGRDAFLRFAQKHPRVFIKKAVGWGGEGARIEDVSTQEKMDAVLTSLSDDYVVEPVIENCPELKAIHPDSLNTIKVVTLYLENGPEIQTALIRFGNNTVVDNVHSGGMGAGVNIETGIIETDAVDKHFCRYAVHPVTNMPIKGVVIPEWEAVKQLAIQAASVTPELRYSSWDIAVTPGGPIMIEGNWDAEFYAEQMLYNRGHRTLFTNKLEGKTND